MKEFNSSGELIIQDATITEPGSPVNKAYVDDSVSGKADKSYVDSAISPMAEKSYVDSLVPIGSFAGTGSPEGKVAAPVGSIYVDSAATTGAIRWVKTSGTGNTGWSVEYGDTGWRKIDGSGGEYLQEGAYLVRREGRRLWVNLSGVVFRERNSNSSLGRLPYLFRGVPFSIRFPVFVGLETTPSLSGNVSGLGYVNIYGTKTDTPVTGYVCIPTDEAWPSSLPGTPA